MKNEEEEEVMREGLYVERPRRKTQTVDLENFCPEGLSNPLSSPRRGLILCSTIR